MALYSPSLRTLDFLETFDVLVTAWCNALRDVALEHTKKPVTFYLVL